MTQMQTEPCPTCGRSDVASNSRGSRRWIQWVLIGLLAFFALHVVLIATAATWFVVNEPAKSSTEEAVPISARPGNR